MSIHAPVLDPVVTAPYGFRSLNGKKNFHNGINFISRSGDTRVFSIARGRVIRDIERCSPVLKHVQRSPWSGNVLAIEHEIEDRRYYALYIHLLSTDLPDNLTVHPGFELGRYAEKIAGKIGPHLHISILNEQGDVIDPTPLFTKNGIPAHPDSL
jgi:murein DD-endopeptidase MepM/ murein hydrolase activator NlpD